MLPAAKRWPKFGVPMSRKAMSAEQAITIETDDRREIVTIEGVAFSYDFFRTFAAAPAQGIVVQISRDGDVVRLTKLSAPAHENFP